MASLNNTLYPPLVDSYQPAFTGGICTILFKYNDFTAPSKASVADIIVNYQKTNQTALVGGKDGHPRGYIEGQAVQAAANNMYSVQVSSSDLALGKFQNNQYYKIQIRVYSLDDTLNKSEWSTVTLIRYISKPNLVMNSLTPGVTPILSNTNIDFSGKLVFEDQQEQDTLEEYRFKLYDGGGVLRVDSETLYSDPYVAPNELKYTFKYEMREDQIYTLAVSIMTRNFYEDKYEYTFMVTSAAANPLSATFDAIPNKELGSIQLSLKGNGAFISNITIRRTSSESNFTIWDDVHTTFLSQEEGLDYVWNDMTVESGVWYKYCAQKRGEDGSRGKALFTVSNEPVMVVLDEYFLQAGGRALRIKYDPQLSSFKYTVSDQKVDTIGSKYPYFKRNGAAYYRQFSIGGLVTMLNDDYEIDKATRGDESLFSGSWSLSEEKLINIFAPNKLLYGESEELYNQYNIENNITKYNDPIREREFRESVMEFLYKDDVKLYRSTTEGNILVRLMDISFTPKAELGRYIYSFSATAYEVDEATLDNINKYDIQLVGTYSETTELVTQKENMLTQEDIGEHATWDTIKTAILDRYNGNISGYTAELVKLTHVELYFDNAEAEDISLEGGSPLYGFIYAVNETDQRVQSSMSADGITKKVISDMDIYSIDARRYKNVEIHYSAEVRYVPETTNAKSIMYSNVVGQVGGEGTIFESGVNVIDLIKEKYAQEKKGEYSQFLISVNSIRIEADEDTVVTIQDSDNDTATFVMNATQVLTFNDDIVTTITSVIFDRDTAALIDYECDIARRNL